LHKDPKVYALIKRMTKYEYIEGMNENASSQIKMNYTNILGAILALFIAMLFAPAPRRALITAMWPLLDAQISAVLPFHNEDRSNRDRKGSCEQGSNIL